MNVTQTMDLSQALQTLRWMDEERRKDKALIAALQERLQLQEQQLAQQAAQIQELRVALSGVQGVLSRVTDFEQMVANFKTELLLQMDQRDEARRKETTESERVRRMEYESLVTNMHRLEKELRVLPRYDEELKALRAENQRLNEALQLLSTDVADLGKRAEEQLRLSTYLEEQRRADNRRLTELENDYAELHRWVGTIDKRFLPLEDAIQKQRARIDAAIEATKKYEQPIEELRISDFQREQKMKQYLDQAEQVAREMERLRTQTQGFIEQQQEVKRALSALEKFKVRIERRQDDMAEKQRLNEEQMQRRWEEWQAAQAKEQKKRDVLSEEKWRQQEQFNSELTKRLDKLVSRSKMHIAQLDALWERQRANLAFALKHAQEMQENTLPIIEQQLATLRSMLEE
ncbi:MAG: hypothetical protein N2508_03335 [Anaerolineae bacterium]|nr:hypothetical protein [Anaerolineae bacterium]